MTDDEKSCPFCAETIKNAAIRCRFCQSDLPSPFLNSTRPKQVVRSEPSAFRVADKSRSEFDLVKCLLILMVFGIIAIAGGFAIKSWADAYQQHAKATASSLPSQSVSADDPLPVGSQLIITVPKDQMLPLFGDMLAVKEWIEARNAGDEKGELEIPDDRLHWFHNSEYSKVGRIRILVLEDDMQSAHEGRLVKVRIIDTESGGDRERGRKGWLFASTLKDCRDTDQNWYATR